MKLKPWGFTMEGTANSLAFGVMGRRPLLGLTILLVEDSRFCSEAVRLMSQRSGSRLRRADCLESARRHLAIYRPDVLMVDIGLPDGSGVDLIRELKNEPALSPAIIALSGDDGGQGRAQALEAGAGCFLSKPLQDLNSFQQVILALVAGDEVQKPFVPQIVGQPLKLDKAAFVDDLGKTRRQLTQALETKDCQALRYLAQFTRSVAQTAQDHELMDCASAFLAHLKGGDTWRPSGDKVLAMVQERLVKTRVI